MRILLTGATGFLGRALVLALRGRGHQVVAWVRSVERARSLLGDQAELVEARPERLAADLEGCHAVVNLAGEPVLSRWTAARRRALVASRVETTTALVRALGQQSVKPSVFVSGSAVGLYPDLGSELLDEQAQPGTGFLAGLCRDWEAAATAAESHGVRTVLVRTGIVLGHDGGALPSLLPPFRFGVGGRLGSGRQYMPWIHVEDWVRLVCAAVEDARYRGPFNATAPQPVTNREFTRVLAATLGKPALFPVPGFAVRLAIGDAAQVLLEGQRAVPAHALALDFRFRFPSLRSALDDLLVPSEVRLEPLRKNELAGLSSPYLEARGPRRRLDAATTVPVPLEETFEFFASVANLGLLTPRGLGFRHVGGDDTPATGARLEHTIRLGPITIRWHGRFEDWQPPRRFVDVQDRGPYRCWWHEHTFQPDGKGGTTMLDRVFYTVPLGPLGWLAHRLFVADQLRTVFIQRSLAIRLRFGVDRGADVEHVQQA